VHLGYYYSNVEGARDTAGAARGVSLSLGVDFADRATGGDYSLYAFGGTLTGYVPMPWPGHHTLAIRTSGAVAGGSYPRGGIYFVGGYDLERVTLLDTITTGAFNGAFVLRGYPPGSYGGQTYMLQTLEYRAPLLKPDVGLSTLPLYLQRIDANVFLDYGGAFRTLDVHGIKLFNDGYLIDSKQLHASIGGEIWFGATLGYTIGTQFRLGYAYGFSAEAIPGGQLYFVAASAF
jgi:outer membrane protein assembly factor BamA